MDQVSVALRVNGEDVEATVPANWSLADLLRDRLALTGTHLGCEHGVCGACTVLLDRRPVRACLLLAAQARGHQVTTVEGLSEHGSLNRLQDAFRRHHALQCGFCTPGFLMTATDIVERGREGLLPGGRADREALREWLSGNLCRCTGYHSILDAVAEVLEQG